MPNITAERIRARLADKGWTQTELCHRARIHPTHLWKILKGERPRIEAPTIMRLARALGMSTDYLLGMDLLDQDIALAELSGRP